jgi:nitroreductase
MEFSEAIRRRRMVRRYDATPVSDEQLAGIVQAALRAPSAGFTQGQSFVVVTDPALRGRIGELAGEDAYVARGFDPWISTAPALVVVCTSEQAYRERYAAPDKLGPDAALSWPVPFWYVDAGCALMALLLAAVDARLAAGFLGLRDPAALAGLLDIPAGVDPIGIVTIGRPAPDRPSGSLRRGRRPEAELVHWNRWGGGPTAAGDRPETGPQPP